MAVLFKRGRKSLGISVVVRQFYQPSLVLFCTLVSNIYSISIIVSGLLNWILLFFEFSIMNWGGFSDGKSFRYYCCYAVISNCFIETDENEQTTFLAQPQASLALLIIGSIVSIFFFITSVMLTTAAYKCRSYLIVPWLVTIGVYGVYEVFSVIVSIVYFEFVVAVFSASTIGRLLNMHFYRTSFIFLTYYFFIKGSKSTFLRLFIATIENFVRLHLCVLTMLQIKEKF